MLSRSNVSDLLSKHISKVNLTLDLQLCVIYLRNICLFRSLLILLDVRKKNKMLVSQEHKESYGTQARAPDFNTMEAWYRDTLGDVDRLERWA